MSCFACGMECVTSLFVSSIGAWRTVTATSVRTGPRLILLLGIAQFGANKVIFEVNTTKSYKRSSFEGIVVTR